MKKKIDLSYTGFLIDAFSDKTKYTIIRAGRRTGKTWGATQWICLKLLQNPNKRGLWVDTIQSNISRYIERYFRPILGDVWKSVSYDRQKYIINFANGSILDFGSAERPENLEGFEYDYMVLNEAGIILKKEGLWETTLQPMAKDAQVKIVGTPKGKSDSRRESGLSVYYELSQKALTEDDWTEYHFTCFDSPFWKKEELEKLKGSVASFTWLESYLADFVDVYEGSLIDMQDLRFYDYANIADFKSVYIHADTTHTGKSTSDYFALVVLGENVKDKNFYVLDFVLEKMDVEQQARTSITMYQKFKEKTTKFTYDEKANQGFGFWIKKLAREEYNISLPIQPLKYPLDKISHFTPHVPHFKANRVYLPKNHPRIGIAQDQLLAFPTINVNDDFVDGISGVLDNFKKPTEPSFVTRPF